MTRKKKTGRPPSYDAPDRMVKEIEAYVDNCTKERQMPNKAGLCIWLGIHKDTYNEYKKKPGFSDAIKGAEMWIENAWVQRLSSNAPTGAIFYLKNAFSMDYRDRQEHTGEDGGPIQIKGIEVTFAPLQRSNSSGGGTTG